MSLSAAQQAEYQLLFDTFLKDESGQMDVKQLRMLMLAMGEDLPQTDLDAMCSGGKITYQSFLANREEKWAAAQSGETIKNAFSFFDDQGNGTVSVEMLRYVLTSFGDRFTTEEIDNLITDAEPSGGFINYTNFVEKMKENAF
eukprot:TRINITY_DN2645_c0_g2_i1.p1 TRINITY_DN2645_c0_g2~~TRINITY_DN2645_c0_g2_i1.p1  ORF type:complete len:162 (+),score=44.86 TRINITY_DN2645_c0_g2_i1:60-488(+)